MEGSQKDTGNKNKNHRDVERTAKLRKIRDMDYTRKYYMRRAVVYVSIGKKVKEASKDMRGEKIPNVT